MLRHVWGADFLCLCSGSIRLLQVSQRWTQNPQRGKQPVKVNAPSNSSCRIIYLYLFVWVRRRKNIRLNLCSIFFSVLSPAVSKCTAVWSVCCFFNVVKLCGLNSVHCYEAWWHVWGEHQACAALLLHMGLWKEHVWLKECVKCLQLYRFTDYLVALFNICQGHFSSDLVCNLRRKIQTKDEVMEKLKHLWQDKVKFLAWV